MKKSLILLLGTLLLWTSCFKKKDDPKSNVPGQGSVLVLNEGNFQWGNASVTSYNLATGTYEGGDLFQSANGRRLGDVLQSATRIKNSIWLLLNNSQKIEVVNPDDFKAQMTITGLTSPRFACELDNGEVAVSDLYSDSISFVDVSSGQINARVYIKGWTEQMLAQGNNLWVSNQQSGKIYRIAIDQKMVMDSVDIGFGSFSLYEDSQKKIWIATKGNKDLNIPSMIHCMEPSTQNMLFSEELGEFGVQDFFMDEQDRLYYIYSNKLFRFSITDKKLPQTPFYTGPAGILYAVESHGSKVLLCDAIDYVQNGIVTVLDEEGAILSTFHAGRIPNGFLFIP